MASPNALMNVFLECPNLVYHQLIIIFMRTLMTTLMRDVYKASH